MIPCRQPDLNAPRFRLPVHGTLNYAFCESAKKKHAELAGLDNSTIIGVIRTVNRVFREQAISHRDGVELPKQLGNIFIGSCPPKVYPNVNYQESVKHLRLVQHRNWESDQFLMKIFYTNYETKYHFRHHELWGFQACRTFTRTASEAYVREWKKYIQIDHCLKISRMFRTSHYKISMQQKLERELETYNELDL